MTLAVILPPAIPDPPIKLTSALPSIIGITSPVPNRGDKVTLLPDSSAYITNMFAPAIWVPCPNPIQDILDGPVICRNMVPLPVGEVAVEGGMVMV